jgi:hypothetical protein
MEAKQRVVGLHLHVKTAILEMTIRDGNLM